MHTLEFGPGKKWIMNEPSSDVMPYDNKPAGIAEFTNTYSFMISALQNALGESSQGISNLSAFGGEKTATEVKDMALRRNARDNFNQIFLSEALKKQMGFWHLMDRQFLFSDSHDQQKVIRIVGKDAIAYFQKQGLDANDISPEAANMIADMADEEMNIPPADLATPISTVNVGGEQIPKFTVEPGSDTGTLIIEKDDLSGTYDYIPDVGSMQLPDDAQLVAAKREAITTALNPTTNQLMMSQGYQIKFKELFEDFLEQVGMTDANKYFEKLPQGGLGGTNQTGGVGPQGMPGMGGLNPDQGLGGTLPTMAPGQAGPVVS
jgi:hypothetical protein